MRTPEAPEPLRFRYRVKLLPSLVVLAILLVLGTLCVHAARSGWGIPLRGLRHVAVFDPALFWWSVAGILAGVLLFWSRSFISALGPGKTLALTADNLVFSSRSSADRERISYRAIDTIRCVDVSAVAAFIVLKAGRVEKRLHSGYFDSLPDFYAFWSALRTRVKPAAVQEDDGSTQRAFESAPWPRRIGIGTGILVAVAGVVFAFVHPPAHRHAVPAQAEDRPAASLPLAVFVRENIATAEQRAEFEQLHLDMPFPKPLETTQWLVDRRQQVYFVAQGGGQDESPYLFALVLPQEAITVHVEARVQTKGSMAKGIEMDWDVISVQLARKHAAAAPRCLELVRQAMHDLYVYTDPNLIKQVRVRLPSPTFT